MIPKISTLVFSEVIPDSNKTIDDQYLNLNFLVPMQQFIVALKKTCTKLFMKIHWKTPTIEFCNFTKIGLQHGRTENLLKVVAFSTRTGLPSTKNKIYYSGNTTYDK